MCLEGNLRAAKGVPNGKRKEHIADFILENRASTSSIKILLTVKSGGAVGKPVSNVMPIFVQH